MTMTTRRVFDAEFKRKAVELSYTLTVIRLAQKWQEILAFLQRLFISGNAGI